jgi:N-acetylmuramoyl-L-alanine amidase
MPAVLCELAFISHPREETLLRDVHFRQAMAQAIADGVLAYNTYNST